MFAAVMAATAARASGVSSSQAIGSGTGASSSRPAADAPVTTAMWPATWMPCGVTTTAQSAPLAATLRAIVSMARCVAAARPRVASSQASAMARSPCGVMAPMATGVLTASRSVRGARGGEVVEQDAGRRADLFDRIVEDGAVGGGRLPVSADLANELERGGAYVVVRYVVGAAQCLDASAHSDQSSARHSPARHRVVESGCASGDLDRRPHRAGAGRGRASRRGGRGHVLGRTGAGGPGLGGPGPGAAHGLRPALGRDDRARAAARASAPRFR